VNDKGIEVCEIQMQSLVIVVNSTKTSAACVPRIQVSHISSGLIWGNITFCIPWINSLLKYFCFRSQYLNLLIYFGESTAKFWYKFNAPESLRDGYPNTQIQNSYQSTQKRVSCARSLYMK